MRSCGHRLQVCQLRCENIQLDFTRAVFDVKFCSRDFHMPEISRFFGIIITMFFSDHQPPHFHVRYGEYRAQVGIDPISMLRGD